MKTLLNLILLFALGLHGTALLASGIGPLALLDELGLTSSEDEILDPEVAFRIDTEVDSSAFVADFVIAEGHYLYQDKMQIR